MIYSQGTHTPLSLMFSLCIHIYREIKTEIQKAQINLRYDTTESCQHPIYLESPFLNFFLI